MPLGELPNRPRPAPSSVVPTGGITIPALPSVPIPVAPPVQQRPAPAASVPGTPASQTPSSGLTPAPGSHPLTPGGGSLANLPPRLQGAVQSGTLTLEQALQRYREFLGQNPTAPGNQPGGLGSQLPGYAPPAAQPSQGPSLGGDMISMPMPGGGGGLPQVPAGQGGSNPWMGGAPQMPQYQAPGQWQQPPPMPQAQGLDQFYDPYALYASALPMIQQGMEDRISQGMASAGFSGNRFGTSAQRVAAQEGVRASNEANQLLMSTLYGQANSDLDRALQASGMGLQAGQMQEEAARQRFQAMFPMAAWEQGRQDQFAQQGHDDYYMQMQWPLQLLAQFAGSQSGGSGGTPVQTVTQQARPGAVDWLSALGPILGLFG